MRNEIVFAISIVVIFVFYYLTATIVTNNANKKRKTKEATTQKKNLYVQKALPHIVSCNSYPLLALVFRNLDSDIKKYNIVVNKGFKGYFKNEERTI